MQRLRYSRAGEEARMLARCEFAIHADGRCGATLTYPIKGYSWRRNVTRSYIFDLPSETAQLLFAEVRRIHRTWPSECLAAEVLYNDLSEKANGILRDRRTNTSCHLIQLFSGAGEMELQYAVSEASPALRSSTLYKTITELIRPYETL